MRFEETSLPGAWVLRPDKLHDERGYFARVWCARDLAERGLACTWVQSSVSFNDKAGTLRGMHYQQAPFAEAKLVTCTAGAVYDVIVDLRPGSPAFCRWFAVELSAETNEALYVPEGLAHGFLTLLDGSMVQYHMSEYYVPESSVGVRWDDPAFGIAWPFDPLVISARDRAYSDFTQRS